MTDQPLFDLGTDVVHAMLPNMWFACGGTLVQNCTCGNCTGLYRPGRWVLRRTNTDGVTCLDCLTAMHVGVDSLGGAA